MLISQYDPIALALQETMVPESTISPDYIKNYKLYLCETPVHPNRIGTAIAIKTGISHRRIDLTSTLQALAIEIESYLSFNLYSPQSSL